MKRYNESFEKILKDKYGMHWHEWAYMERTEYTGVRAGGYKSREINEQELIGIMVTELLAYNLQLGLIDDGEIEVFDEIYEGDLKGVGKDLFTALQKAINFIDWSKT